VWGAWRGRHDPTIALATRWAAVVLVIVLFVTPTRRVDALGPLAWRFIWIVQLGAAMAASAVPLQRIRPLTLVGPVLVASCLLWGRPLVNATPVAKDLAHVEALWAWLREHRSEVRGRVYLQSTIGTPPDDSLWRSQILALTAVRTGTETLGAWYGITPFATGAWTPGEFGRLFRLPVTDSSIDNILGRMKRTNSSHLVISDPTLAPIVKQLRGMSQVARFGRLVVFARAVNEGWATVTTEEVSAETSVLVTERKPGGMKLDVITDRPVEILVRESWHPFWKVVGAARLTQAHDGLMTLHVERSGPVTLVYQP